MSSTGHAPASLPRLKSMSYDRGGFGSPVLDSFPEEETERTMNQHSCKMLEPYHNHVRAQQQLRRHHHQFDNGFVRICRVRVSTMEIVQTDIES